MKHIAYKTNRKLWCLAFIGMVLLLSSCKTTRNFNDKTNLTVFIVDENDRAVEDYEIIISAETTIRKPLTLSCMTNKTGLCIFNNINLNEYNLYGQKTGYSKIKTEVINLSSCGELLCYRVCSADYTLNDAENLYKKEKYQKALELLDDLCTDNDSLLQSIVCFYKAYGYAKQNQKEKAGLELSTIAELDNPAFEASKYCKAIEQMLEQVPEA